MPELSYDIPLEFGDICLWVEIFYSNHQGIALIIRVDVISITGEDFEIKRKWITSNLLRAFDSIAFDIVVNDQEIIGSLYGHGE